MVESQGIKAATFRHAAQCQNEMRQRLPLDTYNKHPKNGKLVLIKLMKKKNDLLFVSFEERQA